MTITQMTRDFIQRHAELDYWLRTLSAWSTGVKSQLRRTHDFEEASREPSWGSYESRSGTGSTLGATGTIRQRLPELLADLQVRVVLDAPCGDWNWMSQISLPVERYFGIDIARGIVDANQVKYARDGVSFQVADLTCDPLPRADFVICRDCLVHLSYADIFAVLRNFRLTGATYLLTNSYDTLVNTDQVSGIPWRPLDMQLYPFYFPEPELRFEDGGDVDPNRMCLWRLQDLPYRMPSYAKYKARR